MNLLNFLISKKNIKDILYSLQKTLIKIFKNIFISFNIYNQLFKNNSLDFIMKPRIEKNTNKNSFFPNIIITKERFEKIVKSNQYTSEKNDSYIKNCFIQLLENIYYNGTYSQSKKIFKIFNKFLKKEISNIMNDNEFFELFKNIYVPLMNSFNNNYKKGNKEISIKKYLIKSEKDGEKIGGTIKTIYEEYAKNIPNFKDLLNYKINDFNNIILLDFLSLLLNKRNRFLGLFRKYN